MMMGKEELSHSARYVVFRTDFLNVLLLVVILLVGIGVYNVDRKLTILMRYGADEVREKLDSVEDRMRRYHGSRTQRQPKAFSLADQLTLLFD